MKNSAAFLLAVGASAVTAAITWSIAGNQSSSDNATSAADGQAATTPSPLTSPTADGASNARETSTSSRWTGRDTTVPAEEREKLYIPAPAGIDEEQWEQALERSQRVIGWIERSREEGRLDQRIAERVERDQERIIQQVGLIGENADTVAKLLDQRQQEYYEQPRALFDAMMKDQESFAELLAIRRMDDQNDGLSPAMESRKEELMSKMFSSVMGPGETLTDEEFGNLFRRNRPNDWYEDPDFVATAAETLGSEDGEALATYAEKMVYLDREYGANRRLYRIERELPITPEQREQLMNLYIQTRDPSPEQLGQILPEEFVEQARSAASRRRW